MTETIVVKQDLQGMRVLMLGTFNMLTEDWMQETNLPENNKDINKK